MLDVVTFDKRIRANDWLSINILGDINGATFRSFIASMARNTLARILLNVIVCVIIQLARG